MTIKKDMVFEYVDDIYRKYFIPQEQDDESWYGLTLDENFNIISSTLYCIESLTDKDNFKLAEKTLDTLWSGDILKDKNDNYKKVIQRIGNIVFLGCPSSGLELSMEDNDINDTYSIQELKIYGYKLVEEEEECPTHLEYTSDIFANMNVVIDKFIKDTEDFKNKLNKRL